jgi:putative transposase
MKKDLAIRTLNLAMALRRPPKGSNHHTDRGSQYYSHDYQKILRNHGLVASISGKRNCYDNSAIESFFKSLRAELVWRSNWQTRRDVEVALFEYINGFSNPHRRHSALGWKPRGLRTQGRLTSAPGRNETATGPDRLAKVWIFVWFVMVHPLVP